LENKAVPSDLAVFGEVGLSGEIRSVGHPVARVKEASSLGFQTVILPKGNISHLEKEDITGINLIGVTNAKEVIDTIF
jgi:DNA repair protein RadA/Sms